MSHEGGPESTQQRTVAELLAMYGDESGERAPRRRRRRDDPTETAPQTIIERVNSESAKLAPIRDDQPPPTRTSHRQRSGSHHQPTGEHHPVPEPPNGMPPGRGASRGGEPHRAGFPPPPAGPQPEQPLAGARGGDSR